MADEREVRAAERAQREAYIAANTTEREQSELTLNAITYSGTTLRQLVDAAKGEADLPAPLKPDPAVVARIARRIELRQRLGLAKTDCASRSRRPSPGCDCLSAALDAGQPTTRAEALEAARALHRARWPHRKPPPPKPEPVPREVLAEPQETNGHVEDPFPEPPAEPKPRPSRVKRWHGPEGPRFSDMTF